MLNILNTVLPVFLIVGAGYLAAKYRFFPETGVSALMGFAQSFAIPCLLFLALFRLDFSRVFDPRLIVSFYGGAIICFALGYVAARRIFHRRPGESVAIGFGALFSNSVLLGLPIMERAYGAESLAPNYALIALHAPACYLIGITTMEFLRADGRSFAATIQVTARGMFHNAITMASAAGIAYNFSGLPLPGPVSAAAEMVARAALPTALFALGAVLSRYRIRSALGEAMTVTFLSIIVHPAIAFVLTHHVFNLEPGFVRSATVMAAMAPGVNVYVFSSIYDRATGEVASTIIIATAASVVSVAGWLWILGGAATG
ncbi:AEC family transporter [Pikeienuella sp. HZG-20]|uniref:AEC family transporter n=1 Tax=Paludibacillus litoralis TaxID=3133267 RepID=UPI0030EC83D8